MVANTDEEFPSYLIDEIEELDTIGCINRMAWEVGSIKDKMEQIEMLAGYMDSCYEGSGQVSRGYIAEFRTVNDYVGTVSLDLGKIADRLMVLRNEL